MKRIAWVVGGWFALVTTAQAASFDCRKASSTIEKLVCDTPAISKLDDDLGKAYKEATRKANEEQKQRLATDQKYWLKHVRNLCADESCVKQAYQFRLTALTSFFESAAATPSDAPTDAFCTAVRKMKHSVESEIQGAYQTVYTYALDKYYLYGEGNGVEEFHLDFDGDGKLDFAEKSCSASTVMPSDPCMLSVKLTSGKEFDFEGWDIRLIKYASKYYVMAHHDDEARSKLFSESPNGAEGVVYHPEVAAATKYELYLLNGSGTTLVCKNL